MKAPETIEERIAFWQQKMDDVRPAIQELQDAYSDYYKAYELAKADLAKRDLPTATLAEVAIGLAVSEYPYIHGDYNPYDAACKRYSDLLAELFGDMAKWVETYSGTAFDRPGEEDSAPYPSLTITPRHVDYMDTDFDAVADRIMAFFAMFEDLPDVISMAITTNDLSASGVPYLVMHDRNNVELHKMVYGHDNTLKTGTLSEILQHLANTAWYGKPETSSDDLDW